MNRNLTRWMMLIQLCILVPGVYADQVTDSEYNVMYTLNADGTASVFGMKIGASPRDTIVVRDTIVNNGRSYVVTGLQREALYGLTSHRIYLPQTLQSIADNALNSCRQLEYVHCLAVVPPTLGNGALEDASSNVIIYVPQNSVDAYTAAPGWRRFAAGDHIQPLPRAAHVGDTLVAHARTDDAQPRVYFQVMDTARASRSVRFIAPPGGYDPLQMHGHLVLPDSVSDGVDNRYAVTRVQANVLKSCTLLTHPVLLGDMLVYNGAGRATDTVPTSVSRIASGAYSDCGATMSLECMQIEPPVCEANALSGLGEIPIYVSRSSLSRYLEAEGWRGRKLTAHLGVGDTLSVGYLEPDYQLDFLILSNQQGRGEVRLIGGNDLSGHVVLPDSISAPNGNTYAVIELADSVLMDNPYIRSLTFGRYVHQIGRHPFAHAVNLCGLSVDPYSPYFYSVPGANAIIETATGRLVLGCQTSLVTDGVQAIGAGAFCGQSYLQEINLPASLRTIEPNAYDGCVGVRAVRLLGDVPELGDDTTFLSICRRCGIHVLPEYEAHYRQAWPDVQVSVLALPGVLGDTLTWTVPGQEAQLYFRITDNAVYHAEVMLVRTPMGATLPTDTVVLPDTMTIGGVRYYLTAISDSVWSGATGLKHVTISATVEQIAPKAFAGLALASMSVADDNPYYDSRNSCDAVVETAKNRLVAGCANTVLDNSLRAIGAYALLGVGMTELKLPAGLHTIEEGALANNPFTRITCRSTVPYEVATTALDGVNRGIGVFVPTGTLSAYGAAPVWKEFSMQLEYNPVLEVGDVFEYVDSYYHLFYCQVGDTLSGHENVAIVQPEMGKYAFRNILVVPDTVVDPYGRHYEVAVLGKGAFAGCRIDSLLLPATMQTLLSGALQGCSGLQSIRCETAMPPTVASSTVFDGVSRETNIYVQPECLDQYRIVAGWQRFFNILPIVDPIPEAVDSLESPLKGKAVKCIVNGQIVIVRGEQKYDVVGRRIE